MEGARLRELRFLGPVEVFDGARWVGVGVPRARLLLTTLLLRAPQPVPVDQLVDELWDGSPPKTAATQVHGYVLRLRRELGDRDGRVLTTAAGGYRLVLEPESTDLQRFQALVEEGQRERDPERAAELLVAALALWRGPAFADVPATPAVVAEAARLTEQRLTALDARVDADLARGRHAPLVAELSRLVEEHPLREQSWYRLMLVLHRLGRPAEASRAFHRLRGILADELGVEPGPALSELHRRLLDEDAEAPPVVVPPVCQLPADVPDFTGRRESLDALATLLATCSPDTPPPLAVISGGPGVGKSALALHAACLAASDFPDGQVYLDLAGTSEQPREPAVLVAEVLHALGVIGAAVPDGLHARAALHRSLLAGRRMLLVLDDAANADQVRHLLPAGGGCAVIVTGRHKLTELPGARHVELDVLGEREARELFTRIVGTGRVAREPEHATAIVSACDRLPLAIRIAAGKLLGRPAWSLRVLRERLEDESRRLSELRLGDLGVRTSVDLSVRVLPARTVRAFRLLGELGPQTLPGWVLGPLLGGDDGRDDGGNAELDALVDANLLRLTSTDAGGQPRYRLHDLLRAYAVDGAAEIPAAQREDAVVRLLATWLELATHAMDALPPSLFRLREGGAPRRPARPDVLRHVTADPVRWFDAERATLLDAVAIAADRDLPDLARELATVAVPYYDHHSRYEDWRRGHERALVAVRRAGDDLGEAVLLRGLAQVRIYRDDLTGAVVDLTRSVELFGRVGDKLGQGLATAGLGTVHRVRGEYGRALAHTRQALELVTAAGDRHTEAQLTSAVGVLHLARGEPAESRRWFTDALRLCHELGDRHREAVVLREMNALRTDPEQALRDLRHALTIFTDLADDRCVAYTLACSGRVRAGSGDRAGAVRDLERAADMFRRNGSRMDEVQCRELLGAVEAERGQRAAARAHLDRARALRRSMGAPRPSPGAASPA